MSMPETSLIRGRHGGETLDGLGEAGVQDAVDAHADGEVLLGRFDVDVRGFEVDGLGEQVVDQFDDGGLLRHLAQLLRVVLREEALDGPLLADEVEQAVDLVVGREVERHRAAGVEVGEGLEQAVVADVAGEAAELAFLFVFVFLFPEERAVIEEPVELDRRVGDEAVDGEVLGQVRGLAQVFRALLLGEGPEQNVLGERAGADQQRAELAADGLLNLERAGDIVRLHGVALDEQLAEPSGGALRPTRLRLPSGSSGRPVLLPQPLLLVGFGHDVPAFTATAVPTLRPAIFAHSPNPGDRAARAWCPGWDSNPHVRQDTGI